MVKIKKIWRTSKFERNFKNLPRAIQEKALKKEMVFRNDAFHPSLKTHHLKGLLRDFYSFSVDYRYRIVFAFKNSSEVTFIDIGDHSISR